MINIKKIDYTLSKDLKMFMSSEKIDIEEMSLKLKYAKNTIYEMLKGNNIATESIEKFYNYAYKNGYRFNEVKEELLKESNELVLFHGSKEGLADIIVDGSRSNCDFGKGFYLGESFKQALNFVVENTNSCIYSFTLDIKDLNIVKFNTDIEWVLAICYYRGQLYKYKDKEIIKEIIDKVCKADIIIAPIADNRMFYIMSEFINGDINVDVALHSLSASSLGKQYVIKSKKALDRLKVVEKYYICKKEREEALYKLNLRSYEIDTKLKMSKREYRNGLYIEEILK